MADGIVYLTVDFTAAPLTQTVATIERGPANTGPWTLLDTVPLLAEVGTYYDTTAPFGENIWYRWTGDLGGVQIIQGPYFEADDGTVRLRDPLRPWANLTLEFCDSAQQAVGLMCGSQAPDLIWVGFGAFTRQADVGLFHVYGAEVPADIYGRRKRMDGSLQIFTKTLAARDLVHQLFTAGGPIALHLPAVYGFPDAFIQVLDLEEAYIAQDQRLPYRLWSGPFTIVARPTGPAQGTECANWCAIEEEYATFADLTATGLTWEQVAQGLAVCPGGFPPGEDGYGIGPYGDGPYGDGG